MKTITFPDAHRQKHFEHFRKMDQPHFGVTVDVDITDFLKLVRRSAALRFTPAIVYLIGQTAMEVTPFRWRLRGDQIVEHDVLQPSFTVPTSQSTAFSFCTVTWQEDPIAFHQQTVERMELMKNKPDFEDEEGQDNYLFLSAFPWASFTSIQHAMHHSPSDSVPRIVWGKYYEREGRTMMPLAVQAHHALVDGSDLGKYYQQIGRSLRNCEKIFADFDK